MAASASAQGIRRLSAGLVAALVLLSIAALAVTQELRSQPDVVNSVKVRAIEEGSAGLIRFRLTEPESRATISVLDRRGRAVATPIEDEPLATGRTRVRWDGTVEGSSEPAEPGRYRVRFSLDELDRHAFLPGGIRIEAQG